MKRFAILCAGLVLVACASKPRVDTHPDPMPVSTQINGLDEAEVKSESPTRIDREGIRGVFLEHQQTLNDCYVEALKKNKKLEGKVVLNFSIMDEGKVSAAKVDEKRSQLNNQKLSECLVNHLKLWTFPPPPPKQTVQVYYPLAFSAK